MRNWADSTLVTNTTRYALCVNESQFFKVCKQLNIDKHCIPKFIKNDYSDATTHFFENNGRTVIVVCIRPKKEVDGIQIASLLLHEAVHIWQDYCLSIGETNPSSEFEAYSIQAIAQNLMYIYRDNI